MIYPTETYLKDGFFTLPKEEIENGVATTLVSFLCGKPGGDPCLEQPGADRGSLRCLTPGAGAGQKYD